jgi:hypothetical protein
MESSSGYRRDNGYFVAVFHRGVEATVEANVIVVEVKRYKRIWLAGVVAKAWSQIGVAFRYSFHDCAKRAAIGFDDLVAVSELGENGGEVQSNWHKEVWKKE